MFVLLNRRADVPRSTYTDDGEQAALIQSGASTPISHPSLAVPFSHVGLEKQPLRSLFPKTSMKEKKADADIRIVLGDPGGGAPSPRRLKCEAHFSNLLGIEPNSTRQRDALSTIFMQASLALSY